MSGTGHEIQPANGPRHDDAWAARDAEPSVTREGRPEAFSRELVGAYSAFEEINLRDYLAVRGRAAKAVAAENPFAAVVISMHTVDLLTARADLSALSEGDRNLHRRFIEAHGAPASLHDMAASAIGFDRDTQMLRSLAERQISVSRDVFALRTDNDLAQLAALRAGFGVGACQAPIARRDPDLVPVLEDAFRYEMEVWVAMHEDLKTSRRMRLMFDWLVEGLALGGPGALLAALGPLFIFALLFQAHGGIL